MASISNSAVLIKIATGEYPISMSQFRRDNPEWVFGAEIDEAIVALQGYAVVNASDAPVGDVVTQGDPELRDGQYFETWVVRAFTPEEKAAALVVAKDSAQSRVKSKFHELRQIGKQYDFGAKGLQHVQLRESDISNLTGLGLKADRFPDNTFYFRSYENVVNELSGAGVQDLTNAAFDAFSALMAASWSLQESIEAATSEGQLPSDESIAATLSASLA